MDANDLPANLNLEDIKIGQTVQFKVMITENSIDSFADLTGDRNPLHMDDEYACTTQFNGRIAHGMLTASYFSTLIGMFIPGKKALYLSQNINFIKPVYPGTELTIKGEVQKKSDSARIITIKTTAEADGEIVVEGTANAMVLP